MKNKLHKIFCSSSVDCILSGQKTCIQHVKDKNLCHFPENSNLLVHLPWYIMFRMKYKVLVCIIKFKDYKNNVVMMCYWFPATRINDYLLCVEPINNLYKSLIVCLFISVSIQLIWILINITESEHTCTKFTQLQIQSNVCT